MMQQYLAIKQEHPDAILFFRLGDFYEMFMDDAILASKELEITLTGREGGGEERIPMCGVPYHAVDGYLAKLIEKGYKVAICEQVEDPKLAKGIVRREVIRVVTPGTVLAHNMLEEKSNNYLVCIAKDADKLGLAATDISTGLFQATEISAAGGYVKLLDEISRLLPAEVLVDSVLWEDKTLIARLSNQGRRPVSLHKPAAFRPKDAEARLCRHFQTQSLDGFGLKGWAAGIRAAGALLDFLLETQKQDPVQLTGLTTYSTEAFMVLDSATRRNLELTATLREGSRKGSLLDVLDYTVTAGGARLLKNWLEQPLISLPVIQDRLGATEEFFQNHFLRGDLRGLCREIYDLERLTSRICFGSANARDLIALKGSLAVLPGIKQLLARVKSPKLQTLSSDLDALADIHELLQSAIHPEPPFSLREGGLINPGYHEEVDRLRLASKEGKQWIAGLETRERERTGIKSLKVGYNKVFGYYIEITKSNYDLVPEDYLRKQTLANAERFITPDLKEYESLVLGAEDRVVELEYRLFVEIREKVAAQARRLLDTAAIVGQLDVLASLAEAAVKGNYKKPQVRESAEIHITGGRHPVVEQMLDGQWFVPNDTHLDNEDNRLIILTGPNMAGKSTYMRQAALLVLMAQIGSFVPADQAVIGVVDRIFTRVGASDDLATGQSTFMVEMNEVANILNHATARSLVILDEIGRGTSTFDGMSIAWAVAEYILNPRRIGAKTLFATHYHQLTQLAELHSGVQNHSVAVKEKGEDIIFLRQVIPGPADRSYGIQVARLAGLPREVITKAQAILEVLEKQAGPEDAVAEAAAGLEALAEAQHNDDRSGTENPEYGSSPNPEPGSPANRQSSGEAHHNNSSTANRDYNGTANPDCDSSVNPGHNGPANPDRDSTANRDRNSTENYDRNSTANYNGQAAGQSVPSKTAKRNTGALAKQQLVFFTEERFHPVVEDLRGLDLMNMTPLEALNTLFELQSKCRGK